MGRRESEVGVTSFPQSLLNVVLWEPPQRVVLPEPGLGPWSGPTETTAQDRAGTRVKGGQRAPEKTYKKGSEVSGSRGADFVGRERT